MKIPLIIMFVIFTLPFNVLAKTMRLQNELNEAVQSAIAKKQIVGTVIIVSQNGRIIYNKVYGWSDREAQIPMKKNTAFRYASLTKPIVTVAALKLIDEGKLQLDDPVTKWLPEFKPKTSNGNTPIITIRNLLTHTAGLTYGFLQPITGIYHQLGISDGLDDAHISLNENLKRLASAPLLYQPGTAWNYSLATDVLGEVISRVEAKPLPIIINKLVLKPLAMNDTGFHASNKQPLAVPYANSNPEPVKMIDGQKVAFEQGAIIFSPSRALDKNAYPSGGAGMVGTAHDYWKFLENIRTGKISLSKKSLKMLTSNQIGDMKIISGDGWGWSLGFSILKNSKIANTPQGNGTYQWGGVWGNTWWVDPANKLTVVILTNTALEGMSGQFPTDIKKIIYNAI